MIDLMALFTGGTGTATAQAGESGGAKGLFAGLIAALKSVAAEGQGGGEGDDLGAQIAGLIAGAEKALAVPDLSDAEIGDILDRLVEELAGLIAGQPQLAAPLATVPALLSEGDEMLPPRVLAEALPALRQVLLTEGAAETDVPGAEALLARVARAVEGAQPDGTGRTEAFLAGGKVVPVTTGATGSEAVTAAPAPGAAALPAAAPAEAPDLPPVPQIAPAPATNATAPQAQVQATAQTMPATPPPVDPREVLGQLRANVSDQGRIRVELRPEGLGTVEIDLAPDEAGQLRVVVRAEQAAVLTALRGERDGLIAMLRDAGHTLEDGAMSFGDFGQGREGGSPAGGQGWGTILGPGEATGEEAPAVRPPLPAGGVDMTV